ncbi:hypothetical protein P6F26_08205 [Roseibacterium sp. SDUM158017]|uniref:hypothetical protein n=1 Tax=Roseicyclus salinarum TaxID=3036773 RepID=UPI002414E07F|nr:hypothetical protein [Roseibacterium sp. SDUM158017]MDG4648425.1 hypothetical protein [Roseibacterium sp. SDUM158017]
MKRPKIAMTRSPRAARAGVARNRKEAAIQLVRLEFDMSRLRRAIEAAERRSAADRCDYDEKDRQRRSLMRILNQ